MVTYDSLKEVIDCIIPKSSSLNFESTFGVSSDELKKISKILPNKISNLRKRKLIKLLRVILDRSNIRPANRKELRFYKLTQSSILEYIELLENK